MFNTNKSTCDGVWVEVPGLFCDIEESRDKRFRPGRQLTESKMGRDEESQSESGRVGERERGRLWRETERS